MSEYIVSARKYRPDSFESLIGQDNIAQTLKNSILRGKLAHAYLFCGPRGVGKTTTARIFAKAINCSNPSKDMEPCGECESCRSFQEGRSYCIHELDAASNNGVEDIKNLMEQVQIPPQVGRYSVYIIDEVHMLSTQAFNAFLKTLEEPPAHAIFILATTEKHKILPTILSRCQTYDFNRISVSDIVKNLRTIAVKENVKIDDESLHVIAQKADGAMRDALTIFDQTVAFCGSEVRYEEVLKNLNVLDFDYSFSLVDSFLAGDYGSALLKFDEVLSKGFNALHFVSAVSSHFRDLMVTKNGALASLLELPESLKARYSEQAARCSVKFLYDALGVTSLCETGYKQAVNQRLHIEFALMKLSFLVQAPAASAPVVPVPSAQPQAAVPVQPVPVQAKADPLPASHPDVSPVVPSSAPELIEETRPAPADPESETPSSSPSVQPQPVPKPRKRVVKTGASLSLNSILEEEKAKDVKVEIDSKEDKIPEDDVIFSCWNSIAEDCAVRQPRLSSTIKAAHLSIETDGGSKVLVFKVSNESQERWIRENQLRTLEATLINKVGSSRLRLQVGVVPLVENVRMVYTDQEKAKALMGENNELQHLVKDFGLETK